MLAPGALHAAAAAQSQHGADLVAGVCLEHIDRQVMLINRPAATQADFNVDTLSRLFDYWLRGHFFYQPEVLFTREIWDRVGGTLDKSLNYTMDYELWMRFANARARLHVFEWPSALFRRHAGQKTADLINCIEEQARVRNSFQIPLPDTEVEQKIRDRLFTFRRKPRPVLAVVSTRRDKIFSVDTERDLQHLGARHDVDIRFADDLDGFAPGDVDGVIYLVHLQYDADRIDAFRERHPDVPVLGWFWDNHHHPFHNFAVARRVDETVAGHTQFQEYLRCDESCFLEPLSLCVTQWSRQHVAKRFTECGYQSRESGLYGGFIRYEFSPVRNAFLNAVQEQVAGNNVTLVDETAMQQYFGRSEDERFVEWCRFMCSIVVPLNNDLSQRFFDALLAGQIPLVPDDLTPVDEIVSPAEQAELPVIKYRAGDVESVRDASKRAVEAFQSEGHEGVTRRHRFALNHHMFDNRIEQLLVRIVSGAP
jgi:hypothetical protein